MRVIISAAIKTSDGIIHSLPPPARHADIVYALHRVKYPKAKLIIAEGEQGFINNDGDFMARKEAGAYAIKNGQVNKLGFPPELYSEDLW